MCVCASFSSSIYLSLHYTHTYVTRLSLQRRDDDDDSQPSVNQDVVVLIIVTNAELKSLYSVLCSENKNYLQNFSDVIIVCIFPLIWINYTIITIYPGLPSRGRWAEDTTRGIPYSRAPSQGKETDVLLIDNMAFCCLKGYRDTFTVRKRISNLCVWCGRRRPSRVVGYLLLLLLPFSFAASHVSTASCDVTFTRSLQKVLIRFFSF